MRIHNTLCIWMVNTFFSTTHLSCQGLGNKNKLHERLLILAGGLSHDCLRPAGLVRSGGGGYNIWWFYQAVCWQNLSMWARLGFDCLEFLWGAFCQLCMAHSPSPRASAVWATFPRGACPLVAEPSAVSPHVSSWTPQWFCQKHGNK